MNKNNILRSTWVFCDWLRERFIDNAFESNRNMAEVTNTAEHKQLETFDNKLIDFAKELNNDIAECVKQNGEFIFVSDSMYSDWTHVNMLSRHVFGKIVQDLVGTNVHVSFGVSDNKIKLTQKSISQGIFTVQEVCNINLENEREL